jgi:hypothetical protein
MSLQHKIMIKELLSGKYTGQAGEQPAEEAAGKIVIIPGQEKKEQQPEAKPQAVPPAAPEKTPPPQAGRKLENSLDDVLLDFILKKHKRKN